MKTFKNYVLPIAVISLLTSIIMFGLFRAGSFEALEVKMIDFRFTARGEREFHNEAAKDAAKVVAIDANNIKTVGRWPWPRGVVAQLVAGICGEGDISFDDFESAAGEDWDDVPADDGWEDVPADAAANAGEEWEDIPADDGWEDIPADEGWEDIEEDAAEAAEDMADEMADAAEEAAEVAEEMAEEAADVEEQSEPAAPVEPIGEQRVLALDILFDRAERDYSTYMFEPGKMMNPEEQDRMAIDALSKCQSVVYGSLLKWPDKEKDLGTGDNSEEFTLNGDRVIHNRPLKVYMMDNTDIGLINMQPSRFDERVRKARIYYKTDDGRFIYPFPVSALASFMNIPQSDIVVKEGVSVTIGDITIPVDEKGDIYINYRGKEYEADENGIISKDNIWSGQDAMDNPELIPMLLEGNFMFLVGVTDPEMKDVFYTPFQAMESQYPNNAVISGVEVHKEVIDTILQGDYLHDAKGAQVFLIILAACLLVTALTLYKLWAGVLGMIAAGAAHSVYSFSAFNNDGVIFPMFAIYIALPTCFAAAILYRNLVVDKEKNAVKNIFKSYVAPHVLNELMNSPGDLQLGGKKSQVSVLFSDIRNFTTISEKLQPDIQIKGLNHYLGKMTDIVLENSGMIDKFIGDAVMAIWGAPLPTDNDSYNAVYSALQMEKVLDRIRPEILEMWGNVEGIDVQIGVGVNTGEATLGNIGSAGKLDYTVIGDAVNLASRLEGLTKQYGAFCIISENTYKQVKDNFDCCLLDKVKVKGKDLPVSIYQAFCIKGELSDNIKGMLVHYNKGLELYLQKKWDESKEEFKKALGVDAGHKPSKMYVERCDHYKENPPPADWDGSFAWKTK